MAYRLLTATRGVNTMKTQAKFAGIDFKALSSACVLCAGLYGLSSAQLDTRSQTPLEEPAIYTVCEEDFVTPRTLSYEGILRLGEAGVFESAAAYDLQYAKVDELPEKRFAQMVKMSPGYFGVLGFRPAMAKGGEVDGGVYVSESLWRRLAASQGRETDLTIGLNKVRRPVAGVVPARYAIPSGTDVWVQLGKKSSILEPEAGRDFFGAVFKLRASVSREKAERVVNAFFGESPEDGLLEAKVRLLPLEYSPVAMERVELFYTQAPGREFEARPGAGDDLGAPRLNRT